MITFVTWKWNVAGYRTTFTAADVNTLARMIDRWYAAPHEIACVTNDPAGIDPAIRIIPDREDFRDVPSPHGGKNPSCFRRLILFHPNAAATFGERIVSIDLDCVITGDLRPLFDRDEDFVGWSDPLRPASHCGSLMLLRAGSRPKVWTDFRPESSPAEAKAAGFRGSDQAWISYCLPGEPQWTRADGVLNYKWDKVKGGSLPDGARIVFFTGGAMDHEAMALPWVRESWR